MFVSRLILSVSSIRYLRVPRRGGMDSLRKFKLKPKQIVVVIFAVCREVWRLWYNRSDLNANAYAIYGSLVKPIPRLMIKVDVIEQFGMTRYIACFAQRHSE